MNYFLTIDDIRAGRKVIYKGRIVTPIEMSGAKVKLAETGQWERHLDLRPLVSEQIREAFIEDVLSLVEGKSIVTIKTLGKGFQLVLEDNTRVSVDYAPDELLSISVLNPEGEKVL